MNRETLIKKLVARKLAANAKIKFGCVPCFGRPPQVASLNKAK